MDAFGCITSGAASAHREAKPPRSSEGTIEVQAPRRPQRALLQSPRVQGVAQRLIQQIDNVRVEIFAVLWSLGGSPRLGHFNCHNIQAKHL